MVEQMRVDVTLKIGSRKSRSSARQARRRPMNERTDKFVVGDGWMDRARFSPCHATSLDRNLLVALMIIESD
jgi:hypothetical protein